MTTGLLFNVPPTKPSLRVRLTEFKRKCDILTYRTPGMLREDEPWLALVPFTEDRGKTIGAIMADKCMLYGDSGHCATGTGELTAIRKLCRQLDIPCDL